MPSDSYVLDFFEAQINKLKVGPPVYFVIKNDLDYSKYQTLLCGRAGCSSGSPIQLLSQAANESELSYIVSSTPNSWIDDYLDWTSSSNCDRTFSNGSFCPSTSNYLLIFIIFFFTRFLSPVDSPDCSYSSNYDVKTDTIYPESFYDHLDFFLHDTPSVQCAKG